MTKPSLRTVIHVVILLLASYGLADLIDRFLPDAAGGLPSIILAIVSVVGMVRAAEGHTTALPTPAHEKDPGGTGVLLAGEPWWVRR